MFTYEPPKSSQSTSPHTFDTMTGILVSASLCTCTNIALDAHIPPENRPQVAVIETKQLASSSLIRSHGGLESLRAPSYKYPSLSLSLAPCSPTAAGQT